MHTHEPPSLREQAWHSLASHATRLRETTVSRLFEEDPGRARAFAADACGIYLDFSKQRLDAPALAALLELAKSSELDRWRAAMFAGEPINSTEGRAVWHVALRRPAAWRAMSELDAAAQRDVHAVLARMRHFSERVRNGEHRGYTGEPIRDVVNIGIGGSDLGPAMVCNALSHVAASALNVHFVSNIDAAQLARVLARCDARSTLFLVASKTFTTLETLTNASTARSWLVQELGSDAAVAEHFAALSSATQTCAEFGIAPGNVFEFWDWVGGRYSLWSAIGLSIALYLGMDTFEELLAGGHAMDQHFVNAPAEQNLPVLLALTGLWNRNLEAIPSHAVLCYDYALEMFPAYLQQLEMESNGKQVDRGGAPLARASVPVVWGGLGNNAQHAFYQMLHQGTDTVSSDFIVAAHSVAPAPGHEYATVANALAQAEVLMRGQQVSQPASASSSPSHGTKAIAAHRDMPGNRPSNFMLYERTTASVLGALIALYEHKVFVQSLCWDVNAFDQFGVEAGKRIASDIQNVLVGAQDAHDHDPSTQALIERLRSMWRSSGAPI